jgi:hypothetical protein
VAKPFGAVIDMKQIVGRDAKPRKGSEHKGITIFPFALDGITGDYVFL